MLAWIVFSQFQLGIANNNIIVNILNSSIFRLRPISAKSFLHFFNRGFIDAVVNESIATWARTWVPFAIDDTQQVKLGIVLQGNFNCLVESHI